MAALRTLNESIRAVGLGGPPLMLDLQPPSPLPLAAPSTGGAPADEPELVRVHSRRHPAEVRAEAAEAEALRLRWQLVDAAAEWRTQHRDLLCELQLLEESASGGKTRRASLGSPARGLGPATLAALAIEHHTDDQQPPSLHSETTHRQHQQPTAREPRHQPQQTPPQEAPSSDATQQSLATAAASAAQGTGSAGASSFGAVGSGTDRGGRKTPPHPPHEALPDPPSPAQAAPPKKTRFSLARLMRPLSR